VFSVDDEPPGEEKGAGDLAKNTAESVTTINSSEDGIDDGIIFFMNIPEQYVHLKVIFFAASVEMYVKQVFQL